MAIGTTAAILGSAALSAGGAIASSNAQKKAAQNAANASQNATDQTIAEQRRQYNQSRQDMMPWLTTGTSALNTLGGLYGLNTQAQQPAAQSYGTVGNYMPYNGSFDMELAPDGSGPIGNAQYGQAVSFAPLTGDEGADVINQTNQNRYGSFFESPDYQYRMNESMRALTARNSALGIQDSGAAQRSAIQQAGNLASGEFNNYANRLAALAGVGQTAAQNSAQLGAGMANNIGNALTNNASNLASSYQNRANAQSGLYGSLANLGGNVLGYYGGAR